MSNELCLHRGAKRCGREDLVRAAEHTPPATSSFYPVSHIDLLTTVDQQLHAAGFGIASEDLAMHGVERFFAILNLDCEILPEIRLSVAVVNSIDMSLSMRFLAGNRVFCCDNLSLSSDLMPAVAKKHTRFGISRYVEAIARSCQGLPQFVTAEARRIEFMQHTCLQPFEAEAWMIRAYEEGILSTRTLPLAIEQYRRPQFDWGDSDRLWFAFNCITTAMQARAKTNPGAFAAHSLRLWELIGPKGYDSPDLRMLGD